MSEHIQPASTQRPAREPIQVVALGPIWGPSSPDRDYRHRRGHALNCLPPFNVSHSSLL